MNTVQSNTNSLIPERIDATEIPLSVFGMLDRFAVGHQKITAFLASLELPEPLKHQSSSVSRTILGERFQFELRRSGSHRVWAVVEHDTQRFSVAVGFSRREKIEKRRGPSVPPITDDLIPISRTGLAQVLRQGQRHSKIIMALKMPDPKKYKGATCKVSYNNETFELHKRQQGTKVQWTLKQTDLNRFAEAFDCPALGTETGRTAHTPDESVIVLSGAGLANHFKNVHRCAAILKNLPDVRSADSDSYSLIHNQDCFELTKGYVHHQPIWTLRIDDKNRFALCFDLKERLNSDKFLDDQELANVVALIGSDPLKLHKYIQVFYPELLEEEALSVSTKWIEGLGGSPSRVSPYLGFLTQLSSPLLIEPKGKRIQNNQYVNELAALGYAGHELLSTATIDNSIMLKGRCPQDAEYLLVEGDYSRKIAVDSQGNFCAPLPLPIIGDLNRFAIRAVNSIKGIVSEPVFLVVHQRGRPMSTEESFFLLIQKKEQVLSEVTKDPIRRSLLIQQIELSLLKSFTESEKAGFSRLRARIKDEASPIRRKMLKDVLSKFEIISDADYGIVAQQKLYFFQKYTIHEVKAAERAKLPGIIVANEQGLGKTLTALSLSRGREVTIIAPNAVVTNWISEERKFLPFPRLILLEGRYQDRDNLLATESPKNVVVNLEYTRLANKARIRGLSNAQGMLIIDEADYLGTRESDQTKGTRQIEAGFKVLLSATPFKRPSQINNIFSVLTPEDKRFQSPKAFVRAFPTSSPAALNALHLLINERTIRIRKDDVFDTYDPNIPLSKQRDRLPRKTLIDPTESGKFVLTSAQCHSILELITNYESWCSKHRGLETASDREYYRYREGYFAKKEAIRQITNSPAYIGRGDLRSPKHLKMDQILDKELEGTGKKVLIFCRYREQVEEYARRYRTRGACTYYGGLKSNADGYKVGNKDEVLFFKVDDAGEHLLDEDGTPILTNAREGRPIRSLDYERILFQNSKNHRVMIATYDSGAVGVTFTAADVVIYDDLAPTYRDEYQAGDRAHRIDNTRKKYEINYYWLISEYPKSFLKEVTKKGLERFVLPGTLDAILYDNIRQQGRVFHRILDGVGSEDELKNIESILSQRMPFLFNKEDELDDFNHLVGDIINESQLTTQQDRDGRKGAPKSRKRTTRGS